MDVTRARTARNLPSASKWAGPACEVWIDEGGARAQAFYRVPDHSCEWKPLAMAQSTEALRTGTLSLQGLGDFAVVRHLAVQERSSADRAFSEMVQLLGSPAGATKSGPGRGHRERPPAPIASTRTLTFRSHHGAKVVLTSFPGTARGGAA